jgi:hypothetical protein
MLTHKSIFGSWAVLLGVLCGLAACERGQRASTKASSAQIVAVEPRTVRAPLESDAFKGSLVRVVGDPKALGLGVKEGCATCHTLHAAQWSTSMHAFSSFNNPYYRFAFDQYVNKVGQERAAFCGGCHDPALLMAGLLTARIQAQEPLAHAGVTCLSCHAIDSATVDGVGSFSLDARKVQTPNPKDPKSVQAHRARMARPALKTNALCISCHRGFLSEASGHPVFIPALEEFTPWQKSPYSGNQAGSHFAEVQAKNCVGCHMPEMNFKDTQGRVQTGHSHRFPGGHTDFAHALNDALAIKVQADFLKERTRVMGVPVFAADVLEGVDVVVANTGVGHAFPGGARDLREVWISVRLLDDKGQLLAGSGNKDNAPQDPDTHVLNVGLVDNAGQLIRTHGVGHFRTPAYDNTIGPLDARVIRYTISPALASRAKQIEIQLKARRLSTVFKQRVCKDTQEPHGRSFVLATQKIIHRKVDVCRSEPALTLARSEVALSPKDLRASADEWETYYWLGRGRQHWVQEKRGHALLALERALHLAPTKNARNQVRFALAEAYAGRNQLPQSARALDALGPQNQAHPAVQRLRGELLSRVWKSREAMPHLQRAAIGAPSDGTRWRAFSVAAQNAGEHTTALVAAQRGLEFLPRDTGLLRVQMLAFASLRPGSKTFEEARRIFLAHKKDERAPHIQSRCAEQSAMCRRERLPGHTHVLHEVRQ